MRVMLLAMAVTLALSASVSAQQDSPEIDAAPRADTVRGDAFDGIFAPAQAIDHVIVMRVNPNPGGPTDGYRAVVARSGAWLRSEQTGVHGSRVGYLNFATGASISVHRDSAGRLTGLNARRYPATDKQHLYTRIRTGERDTLLGERCEIWRFTPQWYDRAPTSLSCVTRDGVALWSRTLFSNGEIMNSADAISLERRQVRTAAVRPPADVARWATWRSDVGPTAEAPNYEVRMAGDSSWSGAGELVIRRRDGWTWRKSPGYQRSDTELNHEASGLRLRYVAELDGQPLDLSIERPAAPPRPPPPGPAPVVLDQTAIVLGERCTWIEKTDEVSSLLECVTGDGIDLWMRFSAMGDTLTYSEYKATSIRRGEVSAADIEPPAAAFAWLR